MTFTDGTRRAGLVTLIAAALIAPIFAGGFGAAQSAPEANLVIADDDGNEIADRDLLWGESITLYSALKAETDLTEHTVKRAPAEWSLEPSGCADLTVKDPDPSDTSVGSDAVGVGTTAVLDVPRTANGDCTVHAKVVNDQTVVEDAVNFTLSSGPIESLAITDAADGSEVGETTVAADQNLAVEASCYNEHDALIRRCKANWDVTADLDSSTLDVSDSFKNATLRPVDADNSGNIIAEYQNDTAISDTAGPIDVVAGPLAQFGIDVLETPTAGEYVNVTVTALDEDGNVVTDYTGTVNFTSNSTEDRGGRGADLPGNYTFVDGDNGTKTFSMAFNTSDHKENRVVNLTVTDVDDGTITEADNIRVEPAEAASLAPIIKDKGKFGSDDHKGVSTGSSRDMGVIVKDRFGNNLEKGDDTVYFTLFRAASNTDDKSGDLSDHVLEIRFHDGGAAYTNLTVSNDVGDEFRLQAHLEPDYHDSDVRAVSGVFEVST